MKTTKILYLILLSAALIFSAALASCSKNKSVSPPDAAEYVHEFKNASSATVQTKYVFDGKGRYTYIAENGAITEGGYYLSSDGILYTNTDALRATTEHSYKKNDKTLIIDGMEYIRK